MSPSSLSHSLSLEQIPAKIRLRMWRCYPNQVQEVLDHGPDLVERLATRPAIELV